MIKLSFLSLSISSKSNFKYCAAAAAKSLQSCPTLCDPMDGSPPGSPVPEILQARTLEWVAIFFFKAWNWKVKVKSFSHVWLLATPWTAALQAPPSRGVSRQKHWSGVPLPSTNPQTHWEYLKQIIYFISSFHPLAWYFKNFFIITHHFLFSLQEVRNTFLSTR